MNSIHVTPTADSKINDVDFNNLGFGTVFSDHMVVCDYKDGHWSAPEVIPYQAISLMPSSKIFHYGQSIFEGMKAYKDIENQTWLFRPEENFNRFNLSAKRLAIPELPKEVFIEGLKALLKVDEQWIPTQEGSSLYTFCDLAITRTWHSRAKTSHRFLSRVFRLMVLGRSPDIWPIVLQFFLKKNPIANFLEDVHLLSIRNNLL